MPRVQLRWETIGLIASFLIIIVAILAIRIVGAIALSGFDDGVINKGQETITTEAGDKFLVEWKTMNFPDYQTAVYVRETTKGYVVASYNQENEDYSATPSIILLIDDPNLKCYEITFRGDLVNNTLVYKTKSDSFKGIEEGSIRTSKIKGNNDLVLVARKLVSDYNWQWIKIFGEFLIRSNDIEMKCTLERYSLNQFNQGELNKNKYSAVSREEMVNFAKSINYKP